MGINFNRVGDDYVAYGKRGPVFEDSENGQETVTTVNVNQKPAPQAKTDEQILKESETLPQGYALEKSNENPVDKFKQNGDKMMKEIEASLKKAGVEPKSLEYTGTPEDFKTPKTVDDAKYRYRQMIYNGQIDKMTDEEIDKQAKLYIENKERKDKFESTHTFLDKAEYKKAESEKDAYYKQLRQQGLSKKEAKAKAYEKFGENKYLSKGGWFFGIGKSSARKYIERNQDLFYENGKFSEEKLDDYVLEQAQRGNQDEGEATNYRYSLRERRVATEQQRLEGRRTTVHQQGEVAKAAGMSTENNNTTLYRAGAAAAGAALGAGVGALTGGSVAFGTFNACGQLCNGVIVPGALVGAGVGAGAGLIPFRDNGEKIKHVKDIRPQIPQVEVPPVEVPPKQVQSEQTCENSQWDEKVCKNTVARGSSWAYYAENSGITINGKKPAGKELNAYLYAQQLMYGIKNPKGLRENRFLPVGAEYVQHSDFSKLFNDEQIMSKYGNILNVLKDAKIDTSKCVELNGRIGGRTPQGFRYGGTINNQTQIAHFDQDCKTNKITVTYQ